ncbi:hypothetical protein J7E24_00070 [Hymenobacter sp. ISL-91]|uniref:hypothetical protein n=1 Tax=Hymenobacter sp. ISL-91 TaxID=2819151 RepID=UPI001BEB47C2|nr:hypothetical protein [Hymenobacter sp. ISL-91]MBT2556169.1 hypothetical protein [Hymenobacter sp. ISL-91]
MSRYLLFASLCAASFFGAACHKDSDPAPEPTPDATYTLDRMVYYPASAESSGVSYSPLAITGTALNRGDGLELRFRSGDPAGDHIVFQIEYPKLVPGRVGKYPLKSVSEAANPAQATYTLTYGTGQNAFAGRTYQASAYKTTGDLTISTYDTGRGVISGSYSMKLNELADPYAELMPTRPVRTCEVVVSGEFANVPVR